MSWYKLGKTVTALRKNMMRVDLHIHIGDEGDYPDPQVQESAIKSILSACIIKGLDVAGIVSHDSPKIGQEAINIAKQPLLLPNQIAIGDNILIKSNKIS